MTTTTTRQLCQFCNDREPAIGLPNPADRPQADGSVARLLLCARCARAWGVPLDEDPPVFCPCPCGCGAPQGYAGLCGGCRAGFHLIGEPAQSEATA